LKTGNIQNSFVAAALWFASNVSLFVGPALAQNAKPAGLATGEPSSHSNRITIEEYNRQLLDLNRNVSRQKSLPSAADYRIGPDDLLEISILEAGELNRDPRVSASGEISLSLIGTVHAEGLTTQELELVLEELLRRTYIKNPHVSVQVREMQSHPVAVFGAVKKPGVFQIRQPKSVVELLSMAEGLDVDAGDSVIVERTGDHAGKSVAGPLPGPPRGATASDSGILPSSAAFVSGAPGELDAASAPGEAASTNTIEIDLKKLLETGDPALNPLVFPGDVVKVPRAGLVYVVGEVRKPGGYQLKSNENISVLQAIALAEGVSGTSAASAARIIRTNEMTGKRQEIPIDLNKILAGKKADPMLLPRDIVFVPNSAARNALYRSVEAAISIGSGIAIYRR
jgi:polysaccharide export outer membrane protein